MSRQEFLSELQQALEGGLNQAQVNEHLSYYDNYITEEMRKGKSESQVIEELGSPRLIAKTLMEAPASNPYGSQSDYGSQTDYRYDSDPYRQGSNTGPFGQGNRGPFGQGGSTDPYEQSQSTDPYGQDSRWRGGYPRRGGCSGCLTFAIVAIVIVVVLFGLGMMNMCGGFGGYYFDSLNAPPSAYEEQIDD